jgi:hypothetical protein
MLFTVLSAKSHPPEGIRGRAFLIRDNWDDWAKYQTMFSLYISDENGTLHDVGSVKIGQFGLQPSGVIKEGSRSPNLDQEFEALDETYFSIGQSEIYYEALNQLNDDLRLAIHAVRVDLKDHFRVAHEVAVLLASMRDGNEAVAVERIARCLQRIEAYSRQR